MQAVLEQVAGVVSPSPSQALDRKVRVRLVLPILHIRNGKHRVGDKQLVGVDIAFWVPAPVPAVIHHMARPHVLR